MINPRPLRFDVIYGLNRESRDIYIKFEGILMKRKIVNIILVCIVLFAGTVIAGNENYAQTSANKLAGYFVNENYVGVAKLTHPAVVKATGGTEATAKHIKSSFDGVGLKITSMTFSAPRQTVDVNGLLLAVLPYTSEMIYQDENIEVNSLYIGFSTNSKKWYFIDCEGVTHKLLGKFAPGYKNNLSLEGC